MKTVQVTKYGAPEVLRLIELADSQPGPGEIVLRVAAAGINFADLLMRLGLYPGTPKPPFTPGFEVAGTVETIGAGVGAPRAGDRVVAMLLKGGGYAEKAALPAANCIPIPPAMSFEEAAALPVNYLTAYHEIGRAHV